MANLLKRITVFETLAKRRIQMGVTLSVIDINTEASVFKRGIDYNKLDMDRRYLNHRKRLIALIVCGLALLAPVTECRATENEETPQPAPNQSQQNTAVPPIQLKQRPPIPEPPPATLLPPLTSFSKKPLAWRHKALKLSLDQYKVGKTITRQINTTASKDAVLESLGRVIEEFGFRIESYSAPAGHVLAVSASDSAKLIFTVTSMGSTTQIRMLVDSAGQTCNTSFVDSFCERLDAAINKKELL